MKWPRALLALALVGPLGGCEEVAKSTGLKKEIVFIGSGTEITVEGLNGTTTMPFVFAHEDKIGAFGDWPLPLAPAVLLEHDAETATIELLDPDETPGCGATYGGLHGARLIVKVPYSEILYMRDEGPKLVSIPFECLADVHNATGRNASWVTARDPDLEARSQKAQKKLRKKYPKADALPPRQHMVIAEQVPQIGRNAKLTWRSGAKAGEVGKKAIDFGAYGVTQDGERYCVRDRIGIWPRKRRGKKAAAQALEEGLIELCFDKAAFRQPGREGDIEDTQRGAPAVGKKSKAPKGRRF